MNKLNITGNAFPLTVENLQVLQSQTELIQSAFLASISLQVSDDSIFLYLIKDANDNKICAYYKGELYSIVIRSSSTTRYVLVEKKVSVSTDTETFADVRLERYLVVGSREAGETTIKSFDSAAIRLVSLRADLIEKITTAQTTADTASTTATAAQNTAASAMNKAIEAADAAATAQETANAASSVANSATTTANNASAKANTASNKANTALENSNTAINTANSASGKADTATSTANTALSNSETAINTANSASEEADKATSTADTALNSAKEANKTKTYIVKGKITGVSDDYPNQTLMGTVTINFATKEMYLHFKCWSDGELIDNISIDVNGSSFQFPNFVGNPISNKFVSSHNNEKFFQYLTPFENQYILDFNLYLSMGGTGCEIFYSAIEAELKKNNKLILYVNIPYE